MKKIFYGWWIVAATNVICMVGFGTWLYCFGVFFKPMMNEFGWTRGETAGAYSFRGIQGGFAGPVVGWAVDKYGSRRVVFCGALIAGLGFVLMYTVNSLLSFYLIYGVLLSIGMTAMLYLPAMTTIAHWFVRKRSFALSILAVGAGIGGAVCAPVAALLISQMGWRMAFVVLGVAIWIIVLPLSLILRHKPEDMGLRPDGDSPDDSHRNEVAGTVANAMSSSQPEQGWTLRQALGSRTYWTLISAFFLTSMTHATVTVHAVPALTDAGISAEEAAISLGLATLLSVIGRLSFGWLGDFMNKRYLFMATYSIEALGVLALVNADNTIFVYLFIVLFGIGFGGTIPLDPAIRGEYFGRASFGKIQGFMAPITMLGSVVGPPLAGFFFDISKTYAGPFLATAMLQFLAVAIIFFARPAKPAAEPLPQVADP